MKQFKKKLQRRQLWLAGAMVLASAGIMLSRRLGIEPAGSEHARSFINGFHVGIVTAVFGSLLFLILRNAGALQSPERLQRLYIAETDERLLFIRQRVDSAGMTTVIYGLALATLIAGNLSGTVFFALLGATIFAVLARGIAKLYFRGKF